MSDVAIVALALSSGLFSGCAQGSSTASKNMGTRTSIGPGLRWEPLTEGVWMVTHEEPWDAHSLVVEMADRTLLLADTPPTQEATERLIQWLRERFGPRRLIAINGHFHLDAAGGNAAVLAAGGTVYASDRTETLLRERGESVRRSVVEMYRGTQHAEAFASTDVALPSRTFPLERGLTLHFASEAVQVIYPGPSHTEDSVAIHFPGRRVLYGGCMVIGMDRVGFTGHADLQSWPHAIRRLQTLDADHVVPGHGKRTGPSVLEHTLRLLDAYRARRLDGPGRETTVHSAQ